jgi:2TM domain
MTMVQGSDPLSPGFTDGERVAARKRIEARRGFVSHVVTYTVINGFLIFLWWITGSGYFWPGWVLAGWGAALVLHAWDVFVMRQITEEDVDAELRRSGRRRPGS